MAQEKITKEKIILAILESAFKEGSGNASLSDIAEELHIKKASLYNYFPSREAMLAETRQYCRSYLHALSFSLPNISIIVKDSMNLSSIFTDLISHYFHKHEERALFYIYTFLESEKFFSPESSKIIIENYQKLVGQISTVLRSLISASLIQSLTLSQLDSTSRLLAHHIRSCLSTYLLICKDSYRKNQNFTQELNISKDSVISTTVNIIVHHLSLLSN